MSKEVMRDGSRNSTGSKEEKQLGEGEVQQVSFLVSLPASPDLFLSEQFHLTIHFVELSPSHLDLLHDQEIISPHSIHHSFICRFLFSET